MEMQNKRGVHAHSNKCWVISTQVWVKYGQTQIWIKNVIKKCTVKVEVGLKF